MQCVLSQIEITQQADQRGEYAARLSLVKVVDLLADTAIERERLPLTPVQYSIDCAGLGMTLPQVQTCGRLECTMA
jgi:hypothetical protein